MNLPPPPPLARVESAHGRMASIAALAAGALAAALIPGRSAGINVSITSAAIAVVAVSVRRERPNATFYAYGTLALGLAAMFAVHTSEWVLAPNLLVAGGLGVLSLSGARSWSGVSLDPLIAMLKLPRGFVSVLSPFRRRARRDRGWLESAMKGAFMAFFLVATFGALFVSADAAFARMARDVLVPDWDLGLLPARVLVGGFAIALCGTYISVPAADRGRAPGQEGGRGISRSEWGIALGALDLLFLAFVAVQLTVLFGGRDHVLTTTGLTYAQYARQGFFQLIVVAALVLGVIAAVLWLGERDRPSDRALLRMLLGTLCALTLVVLASAFQRLTLYEEAYGFTRLRLGALVAIVWLAILIVLVMIAGALWHARWLPTGVALASAIVLLALNLLGPDASIARRNLDRFERTGRFDAAYASTLGPEAVPVLLELPEPYRTCAIAPIAERLERREASWISYNHAAQRARSLLEESPLGNGATTTGAVGCTGRPG